MRFVCYAMINRNEMLNECYNMKCYDISEIKLPCA